jgi:uncharacterized protein (DUF1501 family)
MKTSLMSRRAALTALLTGAGGLGLKALATGIPASVLLDPLTASADTPKAKTLILASSLLGDPLNANVPGMYEVGPTEIFHPLDPAMAKTSFNLGGKTVSAAKPWAELPANILARTAFFHHATYTPVHGELTRVQKMMNATEKSDMLVSLIARELAPLLGSVQRDPISLGASGGELLSSEGRLLGNVAPLSVQRALGGPTGPLKDLTALRDQHVDALYGVYRERGTKAQLALLDSWVRSRDEVRSVETELVERLASIDGNDQKNQIRCAAVLAAMNIAPVISIHLGWGGDNHADADLEREATDTVATVGDLRGLIEELDSLQADGHLKNDVVVATLNTFGRTLKKKGYEGRDHHEGHHVMVMIGNGIVPGVVGGVELAGSDYQSTSIDSTTGAPQGDIPFEESLAAAGKTLAHALGVPEERVDAMIDGGKIVRSVIA